MTEKTHIVDALGERGLLLPALVNRALAANDQAKYRLTLLQAAKALEFSARFDKLCEPLRAVAEDLIDGCRIDAMTSANRRDPGEPACPRCS